MNRIEGLRVVNAKKALTLRITQKDISASSKKDPQNCAVAIACKRLLKATDVRVHLSRTLIKTNGHWVRYRTPQHVLREIVAFDKGGKFEPGEYKLSTLRPSDNRVKPRGPHKTKGRKPQIHRTTANVRHHA